MMEWFTLNVMPTLGGVSGGREQGRETQLVLDALLDGERVLLEVVDDGLVGEVDRDELAGRERVRGEEQAEHRHLRVSAGQGSGRARTLGPEVSVAAAAPMPSDCFQRASDSSSASSAAYSSTVFFAVGL